MVMSISISSDLTRRGGDRDLICRLGSYPFGRAVFSSDLAGPCAPEPAVVTDSCPRSQAHTHVQSMGSQLKCGISDPRPSKQRSFEHDFRSIGMKIVVQISQVVRVIQ